MIKRKKYMISLLVMALSISFANSKVALAESNSASTIVESNYIDTVKTGIDKNNIKWSYMLCDDGTISIFKNENSDLSGEIEIPSKLDGLTVSSIASGGFEKCTKITSVKIPASIKSIGVSAFLGCTSLSNIEIPSSVSNIDAYAFENTPWLTNQRNSNTFVVVNNILIDGKSATGDITIPSNVTTIGKRAFVDVQLERSDYSYGNSQSITSVVIPEGVKTIEDSAFYRCTNLTYVKIPTSVTKIDGDAFYGTPWADAQRRVNQFVIVNNILIDDGMTSTGDITIPSNVVSISGSAFHSNEGITSVKIPSSVKEIGKDAFTFCQKLKSVEISSGLTSIGENAFSQCDSLSEISIPDSVVNIDNYAFDMCNNLSKVRLSKNIRTIKAGTFELCKNLTNIDIPSGVTQIGDFAFSGCDKLAKVRIPASVTRIFDNSFDSGRNLIAAYCEKNSYSSNYFKNKGISVEEYSKYSADDSDIEAGDIGIATDKNNIKWRYTKLSDGTLSISAVGESASGSIEIPSQLNGHQVTVIEERAFLDCKITSVKIPEGVKSISKQAFGSCGQITSVEIPLSVIDIGEGAFSDSMGLGSVTIPNKSVSIGEYAFSSNTKVNIGTSNTTNNTTQTPAGTQGPTGPTVPQGSTVPQGWHKDGDHWNWLWSDGSKKSGWYNEGEDWYYFYGNGQMATEFTGLGGGAIYYLKPKSDGRAAMVTGWQKINGDWYYFNPNSDGFKGIMKRGWIYDGGNWYYLYSTGEMAHNTTIDGYYVNSSGAWVK